MHKNIESPYYENVGKLLFSQNKIWNKEGIENLKKKNSRVDKNSEGIWYSTLEKQIRSIIKQKKEDSN